MGAFAELKAILGLDTRPYEAGAKKADFITSSLQRTLAATGGTLAGAFSAGAVVGFIKDLVRVADEMNVLANTVDTTMESIVALKTLGVETNVVWEDMSKILGKVREAQGKAGQLDEGILYALRQLNINKEDFVGSEAADALQLVAIGWKNAANSAQAYVAVSDIIGNKVTRKTGEMLTGLADEGMEKLRDRTQAAAAGFRDLAESQKYWQKVAEDNRTFMVSVYGFARSGARSVWNYFTPMAENINQDQSGQWPSRPSKPKSFKPKVSDPQAVLDMQSNEMSQQLENEWDRQQKDFKENEMQSNEMLQQLENEWDRQQEDFKENERKSKKAADAHRHAQELGRHYYFAELHRAEAINDLNSDYRARMAKAGEDVRGRMPAVDRVRAMGGAIGLTRAGISTEDKAVRVAKEQKDVMVEMRDKLQALIDQHDRDRDEDE